LLLGKSHDMITCIYTKSQYEASVQERAEKAAAADRVAIYRATRSPTVITHKPTPDMYGIWDDFDFSEFDREEKQFRSSRSIGVGIMYLTLAAIISITSSFIFKHGLYAQIIKNSLLYYVLIGTPFFVFIYNKLNIEAFLRECFTNYLVYSDNVSAYRANLAAWEFTNTERGLGYWQALRGIEFEHALATMFKRRGCNVTTTKASGDGGIDLHLNFGPQAFWCQCKGYAKPVSVAPIREIAGVCSRSHAQPIIFAVNGFTRPAIEAASELGVICIDAPDLCKFAKLEFITSFENIRR